MGKDDAVEELGKLKSDKYPIDQYRPKESYHGLQCSLQALGRFQSFFSKGNFGGVAEAPGNYEEVRLR